ncbi:MAG TPA: DUF2285 domain-containing protein [Bradyrhizobium sp.]|uniref:DUF2285 domain-containing protein n=1 Tax=Bradyrhizobium sp. TaxID=376 RepID=UPI002CF721F1|nr:DUF2285 domain-containing protein [Bradyrhizobium sp.]HLZ03072.1 DUF2285 domain-containing protein [Bradyrhizobium sp.]
MSSLTFKQLPPAAFVVSRPDGRHVLLRGHGGNRQLWMLADAPPTAPFAAVIPFDAHMPQRVEAALHLWLSLTRSAPPPVAPLTAQQRRRLILMLRALDGWQQHASYREIAAVLLDPLVRGQSRREWLTSPRRAQIIRLVRDGIRRMRGGYRDLLRGD